MDRLKHLFSESLQTGFVDKEVISDVVYQPELLVNQKNPRKKILSTILKELDTSIEFFISVAFVTTSGVATIINKLKELENKGVKGHILVSQYLNFTQPEALKRLLQFKNIDLRILTNSNAHAKGYIFKNNTHYNLIIGSSNLTASALTTNKEWNLKVSALNGSGIVHDVWDEFRSDFNEATQVNYAFIDQYQKIFDEQFIINKTVSKEYNSAHQFEIIPNSMQQEALLNLKALRANHSNKALIISATGTGKTYLSAFDAQSFNPKKLLFVVHRLTIAKDALKTFKKIFGTKKTMGLYSGSHKNLDADFIFSTVQTISRDPYLNQFAKDHFDYIIIDETHRSAAETYQKIINYFEPKFLLGMTATPERSDTNNIFELFDYNVAYEIRLNRAMEEEMLTTFHYYGVTDITIDNVSIENKADFRLLVSNERIDRILEQAQFYGSDNGITRGLIFCSRKDEAKELSRLLNLKGLKTVALTGENSENERARAIEQLETDQLSEKLDYIITVDIFNEGVDIPRINQIIMLRPTESAIVFIQQLGRGLRKVEGKNYLTVIDFIGNYENNYLIPIALYGDTSYNKDTIRKLINDGSRMIPGASTINFDEVTKEKIFQSIDAANLQLFADLKKDYFLLKYCLGRNPMMMDFVENASRDPYLFVEYSKSYYNFVQKVEKITGTLLSPKELKLLELFDKEINNSKRVEESLILNILISKHSLPVIELKQIINEKFGYKLTDETINSCIRNLNFEFVRESKNNKLLSVKEIYELDIINIYNGCFIFSDNFNTFLENETFKNYLLDSTNYSIHQFSILFNRENWKDGFVLYRKYSRKDVFRILNVSENPVAQNVGGYLVSADNSNCPIFVNYHKEEDISESTKYEDEFINPNEFNWMSKSNRKIESNDVQAILGKKGKIRLPLFIKKNNDEGMDFYYMGEIVPNYNFVEQATMSNDRGGKVSVVKIRFNVTPSVQDSIYSYLNDNSSDQKKKNTEEPNIIEIEEDKIRIPLYNFYAAAGSFSELQSDNNFKLIEAPASVSNPDDYFACKIMGESMNRIIENGSICLFKKYSGGSRNGKIVLVENLDKQDIDFNSAFTIKTYSSEKNISEEGWQHISIKLLPNSYDSSYKAIIINEDEAENMRIIGEFISIIH